MQTTENAPLQLSLSRSSIYQSVCSDNFRVHTKWIVFCSISKCPRKCDIKGSVLQREAPLSLVSSQTFLSWSLWQWRCLNLWGPSSSIPMTALYLMSLKMHALLAWKNGGEKVKMGNLKWRINWAEIELLLLGKENIMLIEVLNCFGERENGDTYAVSSEDIKLIH